MTSQGAPAQCSGILCRRYHGDVHSARAERENNIVLGNKHLWKPSLLCVKKCALSLWLSLDNTGDPFFFIFHDPTCNFDRFVGGFRDGGMRWIETAIGALSLRTVCLQCRVRRWSWMYLHVDWLVQTVPWMWNSKQKCGKTLAEWDRIRHDKSVFA